MSHTNYTLFLYNPLPYAPSERFSQCPTKILYVLLISHMQQVIMFNPADFKLLCHMLNILTLTTLPTRASGIIMAVPRLNLNGTGDVLVTLSLGTFSHPFCGFSDSWQCLSITMGILFVCHPLCGKKIRDITETTFCKKPDILDHVNSAHQNTEFTMVSEKNGHPPPLLWH
jgi:hypothetical protein